MNNISILNFNDEILKLEIIDSIAFLTIKDNALSKLANIGFDNRFIKVLDIIINSPKIRMICIYNMPKAFDDLNFYLYLKSLFSKTDNLKEYTPLKNRLENIMFFQELIKKLFNSNKLTVGFLSGRIVTAWASAFLALDIRFAADNLVLSFAHSGYGLHPSGGFPFFLKKYLGLGKANEILLTSRELDAAEADRLDLVSGIFPADLFDGMYKELAKNLSKFNKHTIEITKQLNQTLRSELDIFFELEKNILAQEYKLS